MANRKTGSGYNLKNTVICYSGGNLKHIVLISTRKPNQSISRRLDIPNSSVRLQLRPAFPFGLLRTDFIPNLYTPCVIKHVLPTPSGNRVPLSLCTFICNIYEVRHHMFCNHFFSISSGNSVTFLFVIHLCLPHAATITSRMLQTGNKKFKPVRSKMVLVYKYVLFLFIYYVSYPLAPVAYLGVGSTGPWLPLAEFVFACNMPRHYTVAW